MQNAAASSESSLAIPQKLSIKPRVPAIPLPRELKTHVHSKTYTRTSVAALFTIAKHWRPQCPSAGEPTETQPSMGCYSAINGHKLLTHALSQAWETLHQAKEASHEGPHIIGLHWYEMCRKGKLMDTKSRLGVSWGWGGTEATCKHAQGIILGHEKFYTDLWWWFHDLAKVTKNHWTVHLKDGHFMIHEIQPQQSSLKEKRTFSLFTCLPQVTAGEVGQRLHSTRLIWHLAKSLARDERSMSGGRMTFWKTKQNTKFRCLLLPHDLPKLCIPVSSSTPSSTRTDQLYRPPSRRVPGPQADHRGTNTSGRIPTDHPPSAVFVSVQSLKR